MPAPDRLRPLRGLRVVADAAALDRAGWRGDGEITVLRSAPDEVFAVGASGVDVDDEHAIIVEEVGFVGGSVALDEVRDHLEWALPAMRPVLAQGSIAGVPAKLWLGADDGTAFLVVLAAYGADLGDRLGWSG